MSFDLDARHHRRSLIVRAVSATAAVTCGALRPAPAAAQEPLTVFAAASLTDVFDAQAAGFRRAGGGEVRRSYAASSALARQIEAGAPADIFISADSQWMDHIAQRRLVRSGARRDLLANRLVLIAPVASRIRITIGPDMPLAAALGGGRLAMAAPQVPAGRYGRAALARLGVWPGVAARVAPTDNVRAALAYVSRGETPLGIVYETDAQTDPKVRIVGVFPPGSHPPIVYPVAILARSRNLAAPRFLAYLATPAAQAVFRRYGFTPLPGR